MYVCICNAITDKQIRRAAESGARDLWTLQKELGVAAGCGNCKEHAMSIVRKTRFDVAPSKPTLYRPSAA